MRRTNPKKSKDKLWADAPITKDVSYSADDKIAARIIKNASKKTVEPIETYSVRPFETELSSSAEAGVTKEGMSIFSVISFLTTTFLLVAYCALVYDFYQYASVPDIQKDRWSKEKHLWSYGTTCDRRLICRHAHSILHPVAVHAGLATSYNVQLEDFYRIHNSTKLKEPGFLGKLLTKHAGKELKLLRKLRKTYNLSYEDQIKTDEKSQVERMKDEHRAKRKKRMQEEAVRSKMDEEAAENYAEAVEEEDEDEPEEPEEEEESDVIDLDAEDAEVIELD